jgi:hypothetical protein
MLEIHFAAAQSPKEWMGLFWRARYINHPLYQAEQTKARDLKDQRNT